MTAAELERLAREQRHVLLACARQRARTSEDAEDAVQQALTIAFAIRERIRPRSAVAYIAVIAQHEASRLGRLSDGLVSLDQPVASGQATRHDALPDHREADRDAVIDALSALRRAKPDQARALIARALGWRYREICDAFEWTYTKTNRCVTEGRADLRRRAGTGS
jgi:DNA-directed RNA polymerase specialized sigma24 family protein